MKKKAFIGQFLYDQDKKILYKYELVDPITLDFYFSKTLGQEVKRNKTLHKDIMTSEDYNKCRGRVFCLPNDTFMIVCGTWIFKYQNAIELICKTFNLDQSNVRILIHKHWNIENNKSLL